MTSSLRWGSALAASLLWVGCYEHHQRPAELVDGSVDGGDGGGGDGGGGDGGGGDGGRDGGGVDASDGAIEGCPVRVPDDLPTLQQALDETLCPVIVVTQSQRGPTVHVNRDVTITTPQQEPEAIVLMGDGSGSVLVVNGDVRVTLAGLEIADGASRAGAGIQSIGHLTLRNVTVRDNEVASDGMPAMGGGLLQTGGSLRLEGDVTFERNRARGLDATASAFGGAIALMGSEFSMAGTLTVRDNHAAARAGAMGGGVVITQAVVVGQRLRFENNSATLTIDGEAHPWPLSAGGAVAIWNGTFDATDVSFTDNRVTANGDAVVGLRAQGGGVYCGLPGTLRLRRGTARGGVVEATSHLAGAVVFAQGGFITGQCETTVEDFTISDHRVTATSADRGVTLAEGGALLCQQSSWTVRRTRVEGSDVLARINGRAPEPDSDLANVRSFSVGGAFATHDCRVELTDSLMRDNHATLEASGERGVDGLAGGGAIALRTENNANLFGLRQLNLARSSLIDNTVSATAERGAVTAYGGGIFHWGQSLLPSLVLVHNTTLSANHVRARSGSGDALGRGGAMAVDALDAEMETIHLTNTTVTGNDVAADVTRGGAFDLVLHPTETPATTPTTIAIDHSIVWRNTIDSVTVGDDCSGAPLTGGNNLISDLTCFATVDGTNRNQDPQLGLRAAISPTCVAHPIATTSPAHNGGAPGRCPAPTFSTPMVTTVDQCERPRRGACDIGSIEATP